MHSRDIMTTQVVTVAPDTPVSAIADLLLRNCISAVPVVDEHGAVVGIVSEGDLMRRPEADTDRRRRSWWLRLAAGSAELAGEYSKTHGQLASHVMTRNVIAVDENTPVAEIAQLLEEKHIKRVPVLRDGALVGIVSRANLIRGLATVRQAPLAAVGKTDRVLRQDVLDALRNEPWANLSFVNATVEGGVVHLWGLSESPEQHSAYEIAAAGVPGVGSVQNHLSRAMPEFFWAE